MALSLHGWMYLGVGGMVGCDQWLPMKNSDGTWTFYNLDSGLALDDPAYITGDPV